MKRKKYFIILLLTIATEIAFGQKLTLEYCLDKAEKISPLFRQKLQYETLEELTQKNVSNANLRITSYNVCYTKLLRLEIAGDSEEQRIQKRVVRHHHLFGDAVFIV